RPAPQAADAPRRTTVSARPRTAVPADSPRGMPPQNVLAMQRTMGNGAVSRLLAADGAAARTPRKTGLPVQRLVQWSTRSPPQKDDDEVVENISIPRPSGIGKNSPSQNNAHTTAFQIFIDAIEKRLKGKTYILCIAEIEKMRDEVAKLPGAVDNKAT